MAYFITLIMKIWRLPLQNWKLTTRPSDPPANWISTHSKRGAHPTCQFWHGYFAWTDYMQNKLEEEKQKTIGSEWIGEKSYFENRCPLWYNLRHKIWCEEGGNSKKTRSGSPTDGKNIIISSWIISLNLVYFLSLVLFLLYCQCWEM